MTFQICFCLTYFVAPCLHAAPSMRRPAAATADGGDACLLSPSRPRPAALRASASAAAAPLTSAGRYIVLFKDSVTQPAAAADR